jgi:hypothetical protein
MRKKNRKQISKRDVAQEILETVRHRIQSGSACSHCELADVQRRLGPREVLS